MVSRKEERKNAKKLKKLQAKAFAQRKPIEQIMRQDMKLTKEDKKKNKRKRQRETRKFERQAAKHEESESENEDSDFSEDEETLKNTKKNGGMIEVSVHKGKRKYGDESATDSDEDLTYEQYLEDVKRVKRQRQIDQEGGEEDDAAIRKYGVLLGLSDKKKDKDGSVKVPKALKSDGLDMLLDFCDYEKRKSLMENEQDLDDDEESFDEEGDEEEDEKEEVEQEMDLSEGEENMENEEEFEDEECFEDEDEDEEIEENEKEVKEAEDIYGRKINKETGRLIDFDPKAAKRKLEELDEQSTSTAEQKAKVDRTVTGIINRLSDATLIKSQQAIQELWVASSKNDVKSSLCKILTRVLSSTFRVQDSLLTTYAALISMCHTQISNEISAHFVEVFLCEMVKLAQEEDEERFADDKSLENRVVFVAFTVVFRIIQPSVLIELVDKFAINLTLLNIQSIYLFISYAYKSLKKTSWSQVTEKIDMICAEFAKKPISALPRAKFLLEQVESLKKASPKNIDYSVIDHQVKVLQGLAKKKNSSADSKELGMSLNDLLHAEERGRWWVVGSAFRLPEQGGYGLLATAMNSSSQKNPTTFPSEVVELARKAGMNSEIRRNIFCTVATAEDEDEAFERLVKLSLKGEKERELVHVLVLMMLKEKTYNAFYAAILQRFCEFNKRFVITLQYALWDRLRECDTLKVNQRNSLAQLLHGLVASEVMPITVLKSIEWATRWPSLTALLKKFFLSLAKSPESVLRRVFEPLTNSEKRGKFEMLSEGMRVFWHMHLKDSETYTKINRWIMESGYD
ncbi:unnamed protein product [Caenorhabditis angaria]|uniref:MI domain-containing protein n=1 Tax=Caenorhabditis angaria TaxID=860376 RepID=A0A9P1I7K7_9PELO|nr:unnamed protein product [Caenorhabditis angaria]